MTAAVRYVAPNLVTCIGLCAGLLSICETIAGEFVSAAWFIMLSVLLDKLDGGVARLLNASSRFGMELDSLSDLITFGVAPGVLVLGIMTGAGPGEVLAPAGSLLRAATYAGVFFYVIAAALRLAKFNVLTDDYGKDYFFGLPSTAGGALVAIYYLTVTKYGLSLVYIQVLPGMLGLYGLWMVSRLPLPKFNKRRAAWLNIFQLVNVVLIYIFGVARIFPGYIFACGALYLSVGTIWAMIKRIKPPPVQAAE